MRDIIVNATSLPAWTWLSLPDWITAGNVSAESCHHVWRFFGSCDAFVCVKCGKWESQRDTLASGDSLPYTSEGGVRHPGVRG